MHFSWVWVSNLVLRLEFMWGALLAGTALKSLMVLAVAGWATWLMRRAVPATRHLVWLLALVSLLVLPVLAFIVPHWNVLPVWSNPLGRDALSGTIKVRVASPAPATQPSVTPESRTPPSVAALPSTTEPPPLDSLFAAPEADRFVEVKALSLPSWLTIWIWTGRILGLGAVLGLFFLLLSRVALTRLARASAPITGGPLFVLQENLREQLGFKRRVRLLVSERPRMPMTWGIVRPTILLPKESEGWPAERLRAVLLHELAHVQRADCLTQLLGQIACILYWFNPLVWIAAHRMRVEQEGACDDTVLRNGLKASDYAEHLLQIVAGLGGIRSISSSAIPIIRRSHFTDRLQAILEVHRRRNPLTRAEVSTASVVAVSSIMFIASLGTESKQDRIVRQSITRICDEQRRAQSALQNLYVVASTHEYDWNGDKRQWELTPAGSHARLWIEALNTGRWRVDYDPQITRWTGGAAPYSENRYLEAFDGTNFFKIDHVYGEESKTYGSWMSEKRPGRQSDRLQDAVEIWPNSEFMRVTMPRMARDQGHTKKVTELERDGRHLIQLDRALNNGQYVGTERYVFDPSRGGALVFRELMILPVGHGDPKITSRYEVTAWRRLSDEA